MDDDRPCFSKSSIFCGFIYKCCKKENIIQPPEEPREQHQDEF